MNMPIRVLCVFSTLDRGGAESMCMNIYRHLDRSKVQFDFVKHTSAVGAFEEEIRTLGGKIFTAPKYKGYNHIAYQLWWRNHLRAHPEHQIIHCHYFTMSNLIHPAAAHFHRRTITHSHFTSADRLSKKILQFHVANHTEYCFACGKDAGNWLYKGHAFTVIHNAIESNDFVYRKELDQQVRAELGLTGKLVIGVVGRLVQFKNPMETIAIFKQIHDRRPDARLLWLGEGNMRSAITEKLKEEHLEEAVLLPGVRRDVNRMLQAMDAYLQPSFAEGLSVAQIEAQAAGLRCFISDSITKEADITGRCTYLPLGQPALWAETILSTDLTKENTHQQIIDAGYDIRTTTDWLQDFYLKVSKEMCESK